jgi:DNA polymerase-1
MAKRTLAVIDGNSLIHRAFHTLPPTMTAPDGRPTNAAFGFISMLIKMVQELAPDAVIVAFDRGKPAFRTEALAQYKMHRPPTAEELKSQFPIVKELLVALDVPIVEAEGWEADDLLGTLAVRGSEAGMRVLLVTGDRDALQLINPDVVVVSTQKGVTDIKIYDAEAVEERFGVRPDQIIDYLGLKGDTSDNIPGVPGVGEKTAAKLLAEHDTLEAVLAAAPEIKGKLGENLREHAEDARVSQTVATIRCDVPVEIDVAAVTWGSFDPAELAHVFGQYRFTTLTDRALATRMTGGTASASSGPTETSATPAAGGTATAAEPQPVPEPAAEPPAHLEGEAALAWVETATTSGSWLGVALDDGTSESLFAVRRDMAVASDGSAVLVSEGAEAVWASLIRESRVAAGETKGLLHSLCGEDGGTVSLEEVDPLRLFDCGVAAYLLESQRSSFEIASLASDFLGRPLPEPSEQTPQAVVEARAARELAGVLADRLGEDGSSELFETIEMPLVPVLVRMECLGIAIDTEVLSALGAQTSERIDALRAEILELAGVEFNVDSPKQLSEVLFETMGLPPSKRTKTGYSTDASVLSGLAPEYPIAGKVIEYRELAKLNSTYIEALPKLIAEDGRLHTTFNQTVAATGRLSSSNPNLQNIPVRTEFGREIRAAFVPGEKDRLIVGADYSQIELRILAHLSQDPGLIEAFTGGEDFHAATASRVFDVEVGSVTTQQRSLAKAVNFGIVYGQSAHGLAETLDIPHAEAQTMIDRYYGAYPRVREFLDETIASAYRDGYVSTMFGRKRHIPELKSGNRNLKAFGERTAMNHPMQGSAADIIKLAMIVVDRRLREEGFAARMLLQVHDELVFDCPEGELATLSAMVAEAMAGVVKLDVPIEVDVSSGSNWAEAK